MVDDGSEASGGGLRPLGGQGARPLVRGHRRHGGAVVTFEDGSLYHGVDFPGPCRRSGPARCTAWKWASSAPRASSPSTIRIATSFLRRRSRKAKAMLRMPDGRVDFSRQLSSGGHGAGRAAAVRWREEENRTMAETAWRWGVATQHAGARARSAQPAECLTKAFDLSARLKRAVPLPDHGDGRKARAWEVRCRGLTQEGGERR